MGALLVIIGLLILLLTIHHLLGIILLVIGLVLLFVPGPYSRAGRWPGRW